MADEDPLRIYTDFGSFAWSPDWDAIEQMIEAVDAQIEDMETTKKYARYLTVINVQHAVRQALFELKALAEAARTSDRPKKEQVAAEAAKNAKQAAIARLRSTRFFFKSTRAPGRKARGLRR